MALMTNPKLQEVMKAVMSGGPEAVKAFADDPEAQGVLQTLQKTMGKSLNI